MKNNIEINSGWRDNLSVLAVFGILTTPMLMFFVESKQGVVYVGLAEMLWISILLVFRFTSKNRDCETATNKNYIQASKGAAIIMGIIGTVYLSSLSGLLIIPQTYLQIVELLFYIAIIVFIGLVIFNLIMPALNKYLYGPLGPSELWFDDEDSKSI